MKRIYRIGLKVLISGIIGILLAIASIFLGSILLPHSDRPDVVAGWAAGMFLIAGVACAQFLAGAIGMALCFNDIASRVEILAIPLCSGLVAAILPFLIIVLFSFFSMGLFRLGLIFLLIGLCLSLAGGIVAYLLLFLVKRGIGKNTV